MRGAKKRLRTPRHRQADIEGRAFTNAAFDADLPAMRLDKALNDG